jgi:signal transduction histidine kinase
MLESTLVGGRGTLCGRTLLAVGEVATERSSIQRWQRRLLPGDLVEAAGARRSPRDWTVDAAVFLFAVIGGILTFKGTSGDHSMFLLVVDFALGTTACLALWLRRRHPVAVGAFAVSAGAVSALAAVAAPLALFSVAVRGSRRALIAVGALALVAIVCFPLVYPSVGPFGTEVLVGLLIIVVVIGWGLFTRVRRELVLSLRERAERLESEQRLRVEQARDAERRRIAREMHDVLAHRLSLLSVHAGALEFRPDASPQEVAEAAGVIRATAHAALEELRDVIGLLREDGDGAYPQPPQPTFAEISALVEESRNAGMNVRFDEEPSRGREIPVALGRTAYRVVQEGLTNARKHAPGAAVEVTVLTDAGALLVEIVNRPSTGSGAAQLSRAGTGTGLVGLAERVALAGGTLEHGTDASGAFVLTARLPWPR